MGCKGVTVYRDGCRKNQPMSLDNKDKLKKGAKGLKDLFKIPRP